MTQDVRAISVDLPRTWQQLKQGWYSTDQFELCSSGGTHYVDATTDYLVVEWPYRTTVGFHDTRGWEVIELCEKLFDMENRAAALPSRYQRLLTILSKSVLNVADFGMVILDVGTSGDASGSAERPAVASTGVEPMQDVAVLTPAVATEERRDSTGVALPQTIAVEPSPNTEFEDKLLCFSMH